MKIITNFMSSKICCEKLSISSFKEKLTFHQNRNSSIIIHVSLFFLGMLLMIASVLCAVVLYLPEVIWAGVFVAGVIFTMLAFGLNLCAMKNFYAHIESTTNKICNLENACNELIEEKVAITEFYQKLLEAQNLSETQNNKESISS
ncbi:hypothetical protein [Chlamydia sp. 17-3921]|uniref:hypothetical protein n=1 Tax=Chlamydia sp. 17-3921 TaxID=2675798 RepID=UPI00191B8B5D|nr:hypothetical protein [Chlamydia sp. 17-3921]